LTTKVMLKKNRTMMLNELIKKGYFLQSFYAEASKKCEGDLFYSANLLLSMGVKDNIVEDVLSGETSLSGLISF